VCPLDVTPLCDLETILHDIIAALREKRKNRAA